MWCPRCGDDTDLQDVCRTCGLCAECCDCDVLDGESFDADEFGWEPEDEFERRTR